VITQFDGLLIEFGDGLRRHRRTWMAMAHRRTATSRSRSTMSVKAMTKSAGSGEAVGARCR